MPSHTGNNTVIRDDEEGPWQPEVGRPRDGSKWIF